jgi:teichuronic acid exporter
MFDSDEGTGCPQSEKRNYILREAVGSVKWAAFANLLPRFISPLSTMILAAILSPADFGTVAVSTLVITLAQILVGLGLGPAVVQCRAQVRGAASAALWVSLAVAGALYGLLWITAPWLSQIYHIPLVTSVIRVSGLSLFLFALASIPAALLQRNLAFRDLFWVDLLSQLTGITVSLTLAFLGGGVWALVWGPISAASIRTLLVLWFARWLPQLHLERGVLRSLLGFSAWMVGSSFQSWLFLYADNSIAGYFLGEDGLGIYSLGFNISNLFPGLVIPALSSVAYPAFCALQDDPQEVGRGMMRLQSLTAALVFPVALGVSAVAVPAVRLLYGDKWQGLGTVIQLLAIMPGLSHLWSLNADAFRAVGRPDVWMKLAAVTLAFLMPILLLTARYGLLPFTLARAGGHLLYPMLSILATQRILGISVKDQAQFLAKPLMPAVAMYALTSLLVRRIVPFEGFLGWLKLLLTMLAGVVAYFLALWRVDRHLCGRLLTAGRAVLLTPSRN